MVPAARILILLGLILVVVGGLFLLAAKLGLPLDRIPGDIRIERGNLTWVVALGTSLLLSILLTIALNLAARFMNK